MKKLLPSSEHIDEMIMIFFNLTWGLKFELWADKKVMNKLLPSSKHINKMIEIFFNLTWGLKFEVWADKKVINVQFN